MMNMKTTTTSTTEISQSTYACNHPLHYSKTFDQHHHRFGFLWKIPPYFNQLTLREKVYLILYEPSKCAYGFWYQVWMNLLIFLSLISILVQSTINVDYKNLIYGQVNVFYIIEMIVVIHLLIDLLLDGYIAHWKPKKIFCNALIWVQALSTIPFFIETIYILFFSYENYSYSSGTKALPPILIVLRTFVIFRAFRLLKLFVGNKYFRKQSDVFLKAIKFSKLPLILFISYILFSAFIFSTSLYFIETDACLLSNDHVWVYTDSLPPDVSINSTGFYYDEGNTTMKPCVFQNIFDALWWSVETISTVGYGDLVPQTLTGKIVASFYIILSLCMMPLPIGLFTANLLNSYLNHKRNKRQKHCIGSSTKDRKSHHLHEEDFEYPLYGMIPYFNSSISHEAKNKTDTESQVLENPNPCIDFNGLFEAFEVYQNELQIHINTFKLHFSKLENSSLVLSQKLNEFRSMKNKKESYLDSTSKSTFL